MDATASARAPVDEADPFWQGLNEIPKGWIRHFAFALVIPGGKANLYTTDGKNTVEGWVLISEAVESARPFFIEVAPDVLAIDADSPELGRVLEGLFAELRAAGERPVLVASGRPGHRHLFCRLGPELLKWRRRAKEFGLDVRQFIRPPLAPHRHPLPVRLIEPSDPGEALEAMSVGPPAPIPEWVRHVLREGAPVGRRSHTIQRVARSLINRRHKLSDFRRLLADPANALGDKFREHPDPERFLKAEWRAAMAFVRESARYRGKADALVDIEEMRLRVWAAKFPGKSGAYRRRMLLGVVSIMAEAGAVEVSFSQRQVAQVSGISRRQTVAKHAKWAVWEGWLVKTRGHSGRLAPRYRVGPRLRGESTRPTTATSLLPPLNNGSVGIGGALPLTFAHAADAFRYRGITPAQSEVLAMLSHESALTVKELSEGTGRHPQTVRGALRKLAELTGVLHAQPDLGLAVEAPGYRWLRTFRFPEEVDWDEVATLLQTVGSALKQRARHERERGAYHEYLDRRRRRGPRLPTRPISIGSGLQNSPMTDGDDRLPVSQHEGAPQLSDVEEGRLLHFGLDSYTELPEVVLADPGYWQKGQMEAVVGRGIQVLIPPDSGLRKDSRPGWDHGLYAFMRRVLATEQGQAIYRRRKATVEPVFGQIKFNRRFDRFHRRGRAAVRSEWRLAAATHNLLKLHRHRLAAAGA